MKTKHVEVCQYNPKWKNAFLNIKNELQTVLGNYAITIEHVGSTSVEGLAAKPIIDIDIVISDYSVLEEVVRRLSKIGYEHEGNLGIKGREAFRYEGKEHLQKHHLYVCPQDSAELNRHILFREYLRAHPKAVREYGDIKLKGAALYPYDIDRYIENKSPFIKKVYSEIGLDDCDFE